MSSPPIQYQINEKRKVIDVLGREIDSSVQNVMRNESRYTPLKVASRYIINDTYNNSKYSPSRGSNIEILQKHNPTVVDYSKNDYNAYSKQENQYNPQSIRPYPNQTTQLDKAVYKENNIQPITPYPYSEIKTPKNTNHYNYYQPINSKTELISRMQNNNVYSMNDINRARNDYYDNNINERYTNNNNTHDDFKSNEVNPYYNNKGSALYYSQNIPQGYGLKDVPSSVYIPSFQPYKPGSTPYDKGYTDYQKSRFGDYTYNYFLNAPMRANITEDWKYPPKYYYNSRYDPRTYYHHNL